MLSDAAAQRPVRANQHTMGVDNIHIHEVHEDRPTGTSVQAGLRRLRKTADEAAVEAADLIRRVPDPDDKLSVNGTCVEMGWRSN